MTRQYPQAISSDHCVLIEWCSFVLFVLFQWIVYVASLLCFTSFLRDQTGDLVILAYVFSQIDSLQG